MIIFLSIMLLWLTGFLTVITEAFTHLVTGTSWRQTFKVFVIQSLWFSSLAVTWAFSVWLLLKAAAVPVTLHFVFEILGWAHLPLLAYPITIVPTLGYRLEQFLRLMVFLVLATALVIFRNVPIVTAILVCFPGWMLHFSSMEWRLIREFGQSR